MTTRRLVIVASLSEFRRWLERYGRYRYPDAFSMYKPIVDDGLDHLVVRTPAGWLEFVVGMVGMEEISITLDYENVDAEFEGYADDFVFGIRGMWL